MIFPECSILPVDPITRSLHRPRSFINLRFQWRREAHQPAAAPATLSRQFGSMLMAHNKETTNGSAAIPAAKVPAITQPLAEMPSDIASNITFHARYSPHFSRLKFDPEQAYYATADSVRDLLIRRWNQTSCIFTKLIQTDLLHVLTNAIGNLGFSGAYADALKKLGYELEEIAEQEKDAALGNGSLGRLGSCFLDSMAILNLPAWDYGLRYRYGLFKQRISKESQEEVAEYWLEKFSPWEVVRHDILYSVRFFGHVEVFFTGLYVQYYTLVMLQKMAKFCN